MTKTFDVRAAFWASVDESAALAVAERGGAPIGRGAHFTCYRVPLSAPLPLVVKRAHPRFRDGLVEAKEEWRQLVTRAVTLGYSWIPPMITRMKGDDLFCIMPWCEDGPAVSRDLTSEWLRTLRLHGLDLADWPHVRWLGANPVITDWSDLRSYV